MTTLIALFGFILIIIYLSKLSSDTICYLLTIIGIILCFNQLEPAVVKSTPIIQVQPKPQIKIPEQEVLLVPIFGTDEVVPVIVNKTKEVKKDNLCNEYLNYNPDRSPDIHDEIHEKAHIEYLDRNMEGFIYETCQGEVSTEDVEPKVKAALIAILK